MSPRGHVACLGAGRMGRGIAVAFAYAGHPVTMIDIKQRTPDEFARLQREALGEIEATFATLTRLGLLQATDAAKLMRKVAVAPADTDRKSTRLNSSHQIISYAVFCLKK